MTASLFDREECVLLFFTKSFERMPAIERVSYYDFLIVILADLLDLVRQIEFWPTGDRRLRVAAERGSVDPAGRSLKLLLVAGRESIFKVHWLLKLLVRMLLLVVVLVQRIFSIAARVGVPTALVVTIIWIAFR